MGGKTLSSTVIINGLKIKVKGRVELTIPSIKMKKFKILETLFCPTCKGIMQKFGEYQKCCNVQCSSFDIKYKIRTVKIEEYEEQFYFIGFDFREYIDKKFSLGQLEARIEKDVNANSTRVDSIEYSKNKHVMFAFDSETHHEQIIFQINSHDDGTMTILDVKKSLCPR